MHTRIFHRVSLLLVLALLLASCRGRQTQAPTQAPTKEKATEAQKAETPELGVLKIGYLPVNALSYLYVAVEKGYFAEQGLKVELQSFRTGAEMIAPLSLGQLDIGAGEAGTALMNGIHQGLDVKVVMTNATFVAGHSYQVLGVRKDLYDSGEVKSVADLKGRKVGVNATRGMTEFFVYKALEKNGLKLEDVELVTLPYPEMGQALANKAVDAGMLQYPLAAQALNPGQNGEPPIAVQLMPVDQMIDRPHGGVIYFGKRLLEPQNHEVAVKVAVAYLKAMRELQGEAWRDDPEIVNAIMKYTKLPEGVVKNSVAPYFDPNGTINMYALEDMQTYLVGNGYTEYTEPMPLEKMVETSILEDALEIVGEYQADQGAAAEQSAGAVEAEVPDLGTIRIGYIPINAGSHLFVAAEKGYFAEQGLEVELQPFRTGGEMIAPLSLGQLDMGFGEAGTALMNAVNQGLDIKVVMSSSIIKEGHGFVVLAVRKDLFDSGEVKSVADLKGRKVAVNNTRGFTEFLVYKGLEKNGLKLEDVELVTLPFPEMAQALANKAIDAAMLQYPLAAQALKPGENGEPPIAELLMSAENMIDRPQGAVLYFGKRLLEPQNHDVAVRVAMAYIKGERDMQGEAWRDNPEIVNAIIKYTKLPEAAVKNSLFPYFDPDGKVDLVALEDMQNYLVGRGYTEYTEPMSLDQIIEPGILEEALERLGEYQ